MVSQKMQSIRSLSSLAGTALLAVACAGKDSLPKAPYRVDVMGVSSVPVETEPPKFTLEPRTIASLTSLDELKGKYLTLRMGGKLSIESIAGSVIGGDKYAGGKAPHLRYSVKNGVVVPRDYPSLAMLSAYAQFDVVFSRLEDVLGLNPDTLAAAQKGGRYEVLFEPEITIQSDDSSASQTEKRNAAFVPGQGQFVLFERSISERVPLAQNLQTIAHEFGHAIFDYTFYKNSFTDQDAYIKMDSLSGLNEGFADFFSYLTVGSTDILTSGLGDSSFTRSRNFAKIEFTSTSMENVCPGGFYCLGTLFAKSLYQAYKPLTDAEAVLFRHALPKALRAARDMLDARNAAADESVAFELFLFSIWSEIVAVVPSARGNLCNGFSTNLGVTFDLTSGCGANHE